MSKSVIYQAFARGFSDYIIKFDMAEEEFFKRFFGRSEVSRELNIYMYQAVANGNPVGGICLNKNGKIYFLWVKREWRYRSIGTMLLQAGIRDLNLENLSISFPDNSLLLGFMKKTGFSKDPLQQYEMQCVL